MQQTQNTLPDNLVREVKNLNYKCATLDETEITHSQVIKRFRSLHQLHILGIRLQERNRGHLVGHFEQLG